MDFDGAIQAHTNWKLRLLNYARSKTAEKVDLPPLRKDNLCTLGQWLQGEGQEYSGNPEFARLVETHAAFHVCAELVAALVERGQASCADAQLSSSDSEFNRLSFRVIAVLMDLHQRPVVF